MADLWLVAAPENEMQALRAIREALRFFTSEATLEDADGVLSGLKKQGFAFLGSAPEELIDRLYELKDDLFDSGCGAAFDIDQEKYARRFRSKRMTAEGATPEEVFAKEAPGEPTEPTARAYETALALMAASEGNPLRAAITAANLARTTGHAEVHHGAIAGLARAFPWLPKALSDNGIYGKFLATDKEE